MFWLLEWVNVYVFLIERTLRLLVWDDIGIGLDVVATMILLEKDEPTRFPASRTCYNSRALNKIAAAAIQFVVLAKDYEKSEFTAHYFVVKNHKIRRISRDDAIMSKLTPYLESLKGSSWIALSQWNYWIQILLCILLHSDKFTHLITLE